MKIHALLIGINHYHPDSGVSSLSGCENDVQNMKAFLENKQWFSQKETNIKTLLNEEATYRNIIDHFGATHLLKAEKGDTVLIHYSGHGAREKAAPEFKPYFPEEKQETMVCYDSRLEDHYDLADKELGVLIERIAAKGVEVVLVFDSCHSGSATKGTADFQLGKARQWDDRDIVRPLETYLDGHFKNKIYIPESRHILLAACEKREKAYELVSNRGSFTTHLLQVLERSNNSISYANLFSQTRNLMRKISDSQTPQFETSGFFNAHAGFLGTEQKQLDDRYQVYLEEGEWKVEAGAIQGIPTTPDQKAVFEIYENGRLVAHAESRKVNLNHSVLFSAFDFKDEEETNYQAKLISIPVPLVSVTFEADEAGEAALAKALESYKSIYFELLKEAPAASFRLEIKKGVIKLIRTADGILIRTFLSNSKAAFEDIFKHLESLCRWEKTLALENNEHLGRMDVELVLVLLDGNRNVMEEQKGPDALIEILKQNGVEQKVPFRVEARNHSAESWNCALFYFSENYGIYKMYNEEIEARSSAILIEYNSAGEPYEFELNGKNESTDIFKLIASKEKINDYLLTQDGFQLGKVERTTKGFGIEAEKEFEQENFNDWFTVTMHCKIVARQAKVGNQDIALSGDTVKVLANTSGFEANIALTNTSSGSRSTEENAVISKLIKGSDVEMINFGYTGTRSVAIPNTLVLSDIRNETQLKTNPLQIELDANLGINESLLSLTFDGEHIIPVGEVTQAEGGKAIITIDEIPETKRRTKSLMKAIKLSFLKLVFKSDKIQFLRWVDYSDVKIERRSEDLATKIQNADNILLVIHGIIGDTKGMAECMRQVYEDKTVDLVLSFDYENLNTKIEDTADALDEQLKAAGIDADSGKRISILAHSMGGLVARYFIEKLGGNAVVDHLIMAGTPNAGSAISRVTGYRDIARTLLGFVVNSAWGIPAVAGMLIVLKQSEKVTPTLEQMGIEHSFIKNLNKSTDPKVRYSIIAGHLDQYLEKNKDAKSLMDKIYKLGAKTFYGEQSNDIAVSVDSILSISEKWNLQTKEADCHHLNYFEEAGSVGDILGLLRGRDA